MERPSPLAAAALLILAGLAEAGCATTNDLSAVPHRPARVLVVEMPMRRDEARLRREFAPKLKEGSPESRAVITSAVDEAESKALSDMKIALDREGGIALDDREAVAQAVQRLRLADPHLAITKELAERVHALTGDDALFRFRITDYGVTPQAWRNGLVAFEVVSTLGIAALLYSYSATRAAAGVYLVQEGAEETAESFAEFWTVDEAARPVRMQGDLVSLETGGDLWKDSATGLSDIKPVRLLRKVSPAESAAQRDRATGAAAHKLALSLREAFR